MEWNLKFSSIWFMLFYPISFLVSPFPDIAYVIKGNANDGKNPHYCPFPGLMTPFPNIACTNDEAADCINKEFIGTINKAAIGDIRAPINLSFCLLFYVSQFQ